MNQSRHRNASPKGDYQAAISFVDKEAGGSQRRRDNYEIACDDIKIRNESERSGRKKDRLIISSDIRTLIDRTEKVHTGRDESLTEADKDRRRRGRYATDHFKELNQQKRISEPRKHGASSSHERNRKGSDFKREVDAIKYEHGASSNPHYDRVIKSQRHQGRKDARERRSRSSLPNRDYNDCRSPWEGLSQVIQGYLENSFSNRRNNDVNSDEEITEYLQTCFENEYYLIKEIYHRKRKQGYLIKSDQALAQELQKRFSEEFERYMRKQESAEKTHYYSRHENVGINYEVEQ
mmetsp:Transcript_1776/g.2448  ORF Transcript_1776/g.2448 Transcript_1776/m.2448 type:complete len:293 (-) Transcript_1776:116-994(-)